MMANIKPESSGSGGGMKTPPLNGEKFDMDMLVVSNWIEKAKRNIEGWGLQDIPILIITMTEELGEIAQAYLQSVHEGEPEERIFHELADLMALGVQLHISMVHERRN